MKRKIATVADARHAYLKCKLGSVVYDKLLGIGVVIRKCDKCPEGWFGSFRLKERWFSERHIDEILVE